MPEAQAGRIDSLTGMRFVAAILVVLYHFWGPSLPGIAAPSVVQNGFMGVGLFFVLSGYILHHVYLRNEGAALDARRFWVARFARIYPAYALALLLDFPLLAWFVWHSDRRVGQAFNFVVSLLAHVTLLQAWSGILHWRWNFPSWSVSIEAFFYLVFPVAAVWLVRRTPEHAVWRAWLLAWGVMMAAPLFLVWQGLDVAAEGRSTAFNIVVFTPLFRLPEFAIGILAGRWERSFRRSHSEDEVRSWGMRVLAFGLAFTAVVLLLNDRIPLVLRYAGIADPGFAAVIAGLAMSGSWLTRFFSTRLMVILGEASYGVYILQEPVRAWFTLLLQRLGLQTGDARQLGLNAMLLGTYLILLCVVSVVSHRLLEEPLRKRLVGWYRDRVSRMAAVQAAAEGVS